MTIARILSIKGGDVATISVDAPIGEAVEALGGRRIGALLVMDGGEVAGIFSERDLIYCLREHGAQVLDWAVSKAMSSPAIHVAPEADVLDALGLMTERRIRHLPVVDGEGELRGIVSIGDLVKYRIENVEAEAEAMRSYIQTS